VSRKPERFVLVLNPAAGKGRAGSELLHLRRSFARRGVELEVFLTNKAGDGERYVSGLELDEHTVVIAGGGDGTAHELAQALLGREHGRLAVLSLGSGNDYAAMMGVPSDLEAALDGLADGSDARWDVGQLGPYMFMNTVGFGFSARVSYLSTSTGPLRGIARYGLAIARAYFAHRPIVLQLDGLHHSGRQAMSLMEIGIGYRCGGGFPLTVNAVPDDGLLDVCIFGALSRLQIPFVLPRALRGRHVGHAKVIYEQLPNFRIGCESDQMIHVDGEIRILERGEHVVRVLPKALNVRLPQPPLPRAIAI
jgi:YegS/Rv2252/BmrU family lipid kinase